MEQKARDCSPCTQNGRTQKAHCLVVGHIGTGDQRRPFRAWLCLEHTHQILDRSDELCVTWDETLAKERECEEGPTKETLLGASRVPNRQGENVLVDVWYTGSRPLGIAWEAVRVAKIAAFSVKGKCKRGPITAKVRKEN